LSIFHFIATFPYSALELWLYFIVQMQSSIHGVRNYLNIWWICTRYLLVLTLYLQMSGELGLYYP